MSNEDEIRQYCQKVAAIVYEMCDMAERRGVPLPVMVAALLGGVAATSAAHGLRRDNIIAALNGAFDDIEGL